MYWLQVIFKDQYVYSNYSNSLPVTPTHTSQRESQFPSKSPWREILLLPTLEILMFILLRLVGSGGFSELVTQVIICPALFQKVLVYAIGSAQSLIVLHLLSKPSQPAKYVAPFPRQWLEPGESRG
jgi:hypothetical protein